MKSEKNKGKRRWDKHKDSINIVRKNHKSSSSLSEGQQVSHVLGRVNQSRRRQSTASFKQKNVHNN